MWFPFRLTYKCNHWHCVISKCQNWVLWKSEIRVHVLKHFQHAMCRCCQTSLWPPLAALHLILKSWGLQTYTASIWPILWESSIFSTTQFSAPTKQTKKKKQSKTKQKPLQGLPWNLLELLVSGHSWSPFLSLACRWLASPDFHFSSGTREGRRGRKVDGENKSQRRVRVTQIKQN